MLVLVGGLSSCSSAVSINPSLPSDSASTSDVSQESSSGEFTNLEDAVYQQINQYRLSRNLPPLTLNDRISKQARLHSSAMATGQVPFSHQGFDQRIRAIAASIPYSSAAENVAYNQGHRDPAQQAVQGWLKSPGHRQNIEGEFDLTGIGISKNAQGEYYFTQIFIKRR
ncbi:CAP domain-containing protein [Coleofasciculus sp. LEGE 07092]|nr:CAP domain-containing protein [Coleofasciculus sp. LEGE 07081]MBE9149534.1 CAP domain-containing protein [Coleofasciculus sp. LEGE 07092]